MTTTQAITLYELTLEFIPEKDQAKEFVKRVESILNEASVEIQNTSTRDSAFDKPNATTIKAIRQARNGKLNNAKSVTDIFKNI